MRLLQRIKYFLFLFIFTFILLTNNYIKAQQLKNVPSIDISPSGIEDATESIDSQNSESLIKKQEELTNLGLLDKTSGSLGNIVYDAVKIDGRIIFQVASSLAIYEDDEDGKIDRWKGDSR